eukprot:3757724-Pyramimonas_sp.AAC.1
MVAPAPRQLKRLLRWRDAAIAGDPPRGPPRLRMLRLYLPRWLSTLFQSPFAARTGAQYAAQDAARAPRGPGR